MNRTQRQCEKQLLRMYKHYADALYQYIYFRVGNNRTVAEDLLQQTFCNVWLAIMKKGTLEHPKAFCYTTARNLAIDHMRQQARRKEQSTDDEHFPEIQDENNLEQDIDIAISTEQLLTLMEHIPQQYTDILDLRFTQELTIAEIAQILDITPNAVSVKLHRAITRLKQDYEQSIS